MNLDFFCKKGTKTVKEHQSWPHEIEMQYSGCIAIATSYKRFLLA